jgi:hypothetical protein
MTLPMKIITSGTQKSKKERKKKEKRKKDKEKKSYLSARYRYRQGLAKFAS